MSQHVVLSVVVPIYNEEGNLMLLHERLTGTLKKITEFYEIIYVNDGSKDSSLQILKELSVADTRNRYISFSRNFGHQQALMAGINVCKGDATVTIDGDLQDPPELMVQLWEKYNEGYMVVYAQRKRRAGESAFRNGIIRIYYRLLKKATRIHIPVDTGDYRLMDRRVVNILKQMPEQSKFLRGQVAWVGFKQSPVYYDRDGRHAGRSNYNYLKLIQLAWDGITAFSNYPLRMATIMGFAVSFLAFIVILYSLYSKFVQSHIISGWTSLIISSMFIGGVQLITIGIVGEYISRINSDIRRRPLYIVEEESLETNKDLLVEDGLHENI